MLRHLLTSRTHLFQLTADRCQSGRRLRLTLTAATAAAAVTRLGILVQVVGADVIQRVVAMVTAHGLHTASVARHGTLKRLWRPGATSRVVKECRVAFRALGVDDDIT